MAIEVPDWFRTVALVGQDESGDPHVVLLDSLGNIQAVMKGEYSGTLKTLATDEDGRLIAILTDPADIWGVLRQMGLAEHAARQNLIYAFDTRGNVIWATGFEYGLQGSSFVTDHADSVGSLTTERAFQGAFSIKLDPRGAADSYVRISRVLHYLSLGQVGLGTIVSLDADPDLFRLRMMHFDGTNSLTAYLDYDPQSGDWLILTAPATYEIILADFKLQTGANAWHPIKLVIDTVNEKYMRALIGRNEVDLSSYPLVKDAASDLGQLLFTVWARGTAANHAPVYVDSWMISQNEPA